MEKKITAFKGFDKNFKCRDFQYEVGKSYTHEGEIGPCVSGFHACEYPLSVFGYYDPATSKFAEVKASGKIVPSEDKIACEKLKIKAEISLDAMVKAAVKFTLSKIKKSKTATNTGSYSAATNTGSYSAATNTGSFSAATNTGWRSAATNTGSFSAATVEGRDSIACGLGYNCKAKGAQECWLVLAERTVQGDILDVKAVKVDGKVILADTFYQLNGGHFEVVND